MRDLKTALNVSVMATVWAIASVTNAASVIVLPLASRLTGQWILIVFRSIAAWFEMRADLPGKRVHSPNIYPRHRATERTEPKCRLCKVAEAAI